MWRTRGLTKVDRRARKLLATGALPATLWGSETLGVAPTRLRQIRTCLAGATGLTQAQRCATTAVWVAGLPDPAVAHVRQCIGAWFRHLAWRGVTEAMRRAWRVVHGQLLVVSDNRAD